MSDSAMGTSRTRLLLAGLAAAGLAAAALGTGVASASDRPFIGRFSTISSIGSTEPANGDKNPYGIVAVEKSIGSLVRGDTLISNFNNNENLQGTGSTIVQVSPTGQLSVFAQLDPKTLPGECLGGVGLTTALAVLPHGWVVVGSLPAAEGKAANAQAGCLIVLDSNGNAVETISGGPIDGPWDMTASGKGSNVTLFVTNVLNGTVAAGGEPVDEGTVVRIRLRIEGHRAPALKAMDVIATGFPERTDPNALVVGPTGVGLGNEGTLYVADTQESRIAAIPDAADRQTPLGGAGTTIAKEGFLKGPLGLTIAPNGDIVTTNGGDGNMVETTPAGVQLQPVDTGAGEGGLFGLTIAPKGSGVLFVNDSNNTLEELH